ncbi:hypothetical protein P7K49_021260 [Saguinus oedipus]|uniref:Uncharacterized protein n=1 Tax=Saguinus oedipus TaxID=9490 RepID=A0ABQ9US76_SAGOE|nr:hypothetical protein P7K49_021260 [Saguinus oedipus]
MRFGWEDRLPPESEEGDPRREIQERERGFHEESVPGSRPQRGNPGEGKTLPRGERSWKRTPEGKSRRGKDASTRGAFLEGDPRGEIQERERRFHEGSVPGSGPQRGNPGEGKTLPRGERSWKGTPEGNPGEEKALPRGERSWKETPEGKSRTGIDACTRGVFLKGTQTWKMEGEPQPVLGHSVLGPWSSIVSSAVLQSISGTQLIVILHWQHTGTQQLDWEQQGLQQLDWQQDDPQPEEQQGLQQLDWEQQGLQQLDWQQDDPQPEEQQGLQQLDWEQQGLQQLDWQQDDPQPEEQQQGLQQLAWQQPQDPQPPLEPPQELQPQPPLDPPQEPQLEQEQAGTQQHTGLQQQTGTQQLEPQPPQLEPQPPEQPQQPMFLVD